jgi:hypothetical protein
MQMYSFLGGSSYFLCIYGKFNYLRVHAVDAVCFKLETSWKEAVVRYCETLLAWINLENDEEAPVMIDNTRGNYSRVHLEYNSEGLQLEQNDSAAVYST